MNTFMFLTFFYMFITFSTFYIFLHFLHFYISLQGIAFAVKAPPPQVFIPVAGVL